MTSSPTPAHTSTHAPSTLDPTLSSPTAAPTQPAQTLMQRRSHLHRLAHDLQEQDVIEGFTRCQSQRGRAGYAVHVHDRWVRMGLKDMTAFLQRLADAHLATLLAP